MRFRGTHCLFGNGGVASFVVEFRDVIAIFTGNDRVIP